MQPGDIVVCSLSAVLALASLIILKLALKLKQQETNLLSSSRGRNEITCSQLIRFLLARFTLIEIGVVRAAHYKLNWIFALSLFTVVAMLQPTWQYFAWSAGTILGLLGFIALDMHIFRCEGSQAIDLDQRRALHWRRPLLYGFYALTTAIGFSFVAYSFYYKSIPIQQFGIALGIMVAADQLARIFLVTLLGATMVKYEPMVELMTKYLEFERQEQKIKMPEGCEAASPIKKPGKAFPSPSRVPKANKNAEADSMMAQSKVAGPFQLDSLVNFLELSQRKRISKAKLPPMHNAGGTPTNRVKQDSDIQVVECSRFNTPIRMVGRRDSNVLMSDVIKAIDDRVDEKPQPFELEGKDLNTKSRGQQKLRQSKLSNKEELKELETINHKYGNKSRVQTNRGEGSQVKTNKNIDSDYEEMNTVDVHSKVSRKRPMDSPRDIIPKCHNHDENLSQEDTRRKMWVEPSSHKRSFEHIEQEVEEDDQPNKKRGVPFQIRESNGEFQNEDAPTRDRAFTLQPLTMDVRSGRQDDPLGHKTSVLEIREEGIEELEEVDLNSPVKRKSMSPEKIKDVMGGAKQKKRTKKRDIRSLAKYNTGSPYLEYLPNMLKGELEMHNKRSLQQVITKQNTDELTNVRRGRSNRRGTNPEPKLPLGIESNNQNAYPVDYLVEDF